MPIVTITNNNPSIALSLYDITLGKSFLIPGGATEELFVSNVSFDAMSGQLTALRAQVLPSGEPRIDFTVARVDEESPEVLSTALDAGNTMRELRVDSDGSLLVSGGVGSITVQATYLSFRAAVSAPGIVIVDGVTDADGWIDVRAYSRLSMTAAASGSFTDPETGDATSLSFNGALRVEYKLLPEEPVGTPLVASAAVVGPRTAILPPTDPLNILGIGYIRLEVLNNPALGAGVIFGVAK